MQKPVLVIMAAGMGSRYGGLKQLEPVDDDGHIIMDFSIFDAKRAGFEKVIFIIKKEFDREFRECIGDRISRIMDTQYVYQSVDDLPEGYEPPKGRTKPYGTGHAVLSCRDVIDGPFAVINADDYYGVHAFSAIYDYLSSHEDGEKYSYAMVGYRLANTLTDNGSVSRGICAVDDAGNLTGITERTYIVKTDRGAAFSVDGGKTLNEIDPDSSVSLNMFGFTASFIRELKERFPDFLSKNLETDPMKCEYYLPTVAGELAAEGKASIKVLRSPDRWYGMTYRQDRQNVVEALRALREKGVYPEKLWE